MFEAAQIFFQAFSDEHAAHYRKGARPTSFVRVWSFIREIEPRGFLAAREDGRLVGYAIFVRSLKRVQRLAVLRGAIFSWMFDALRGGFGVRISALPRLLLNKLFFIREGARYRTAGDAQLLNIAVENASQGRGIAVALVNAGLTAMRDLGVFEIRLEVRPWNLAALRVYEKTGWRAVGRTHDLQGEWIVMTVSP